MDNPLDGYLSTSQASAQSGISREQIANLCRLGPDSGGIECVKVAPRLWMVNVASLESYIVRLAQADKAGHLRGRRRKRSPAITHKKAPR